VSVWSKISQVAKKLADQNGGCGGDVVRFCVQNAALSTLTPPSGQFLGRSPSLTPFSAGA
jgi:hypothetical protein